MVRRILFTSLLAVVTAPAPLLLGGCPGGDDAAPRSDAGPDAVIDAPPSVCDAGFLGDPGKEPVIELRALKADGSDVEGWLRLMRAYMGLGERDNAKVAESDARAALGANAERLKQLDDGVKSLGLNG